MNMDEKINQLIGTYKSKRKLMPSGPMKVYSGVISVETVIADLEQLKELSTIEYSRKVKVPEFIADWIEQSKGFDEDYQAYVEDNAITLQDAIDVDTGGITKDIVEWLWHAGNDELFARAWLDGYEFEEENNG